TKGSLHPVVAAAFVGAACVLEGISAWRVVVSQPAENRANAALDRAGHFLHGQASCGTRARPWSAHAEALLRDSLARSGSGSAHHSITSGTPQHQHDHHLLACGAKEARRPHEPF